MIPDSHVADLLPAYALGCLDEGEAVRVPEHLSGCAACRAALRPYQGVADCLALAAPDASPPARLKLRLLRRVARTRPAAAQVSRTGWWPSLVVAFRGAAPALAIAGLALAVALGALSAWLWQRPTPASMRTAGGMQVVAMAGSRAAPGATGTLVLSADGEYGSLVVDGLPILDGEHTYQVWLVRGGQHTSGGVLQVSSHGYGVLELHAPEPLNHFPGFAVTIEPSGGSPQPTGVRVLEGSL